MIPCCFYPTRVVIVDDNHEFLETLSGVLLPDEASYAFYGNPRKAQDYINNSNNYNFNTRYVTNTDEGNWSHQCLRVNISDLHQELYRENRFDDISVVIVDYSMPGLNGIDFCRGIKNKNIQKVILTGEGDETLAVQAFNEGLINKFLLKKSYNLAVELKLAIKELQWEYFRNLSGTFINAIESVYVVENALTDRKFNALFRDIIKLYGVKEAYLCESTGSFLLVDEHGGINKLIVNVKEQIDFWVQYAEHLECLPQKLEPLKNYDYVISLPNWENVQHITPEEIIAHSVPAKKIQGEKTIYYYAISPFKLAKNNGKIFPFKEYKENRTLYINL